MGIEENWEEITSEIRSNYPDRKIQEDEESIEVKFDPSTILLIEKDGFVEGSMPQHHFQTDNAKEVTVEDDITMVRGEEFEYMFKK
ncbi:MAG: hypothetical protein ABEJ87_00595 [Candidatus Nanohalobium sp.]